MALDTFLEWKGKQIRKAKGSRIRVEDYRKALASLDKKLLKSFNTAYEILHLVGYYEGETNVYVIHAGLDSAVDVVNRIRPSGAHPHLSSDF